MTPATSAGGVQMKVSVSVVACEMPSAQRSPPSRNMVPGMFSDGSVVKVWTALHSLKPFSFLARIRTVWVSNENSPAFSPTTPSRDTS
eukprot:SAG22_NODE_1971_length_3230_cov_2.800383_3_plen_88_part_00